MPNDDELSTLIDEYEPKRREPKLTPTAEEALAQRQVEHGESVEGVSVADKIVESIDWVYDNAHLVCEEGSPDTFLHDVVLITPQSLGTIAILLKNMNDRIIDLENRLAGGYKGDRK